MECEATPPDGGLDASREAAQADGGDDAIGDAAPTDGADDGLEGTDGGGDASHDAGCQAPTRQCPDGCYENDPLNCGPNCTQCMVPWHGHATCDGMACDFMCDVGYWKDGSGCSACNIESHCGATCGVCTGDTPLCVGGNTGKCECVANSCSGTTPVCDGITGMCRACAAHSECASGACDLTAGRCVAATDIIYVDQNSASCNNGGTGTAIEPFCNFELGLAAVTGSRYRLVVRAGTYQYSGAQVVQDRKAVVIGTNSSATPTELVQNLPGTPVVQVVQASGTAELSLYGVTLRGASNTGGHGVQCSSGLTRAVLSLDACDVGGNGGQGLSATQCDVSISRSNLHDNSGVGVTAGSSGLTIRQTIVRRNQAGGLSLTSSDFVIENCLVVENGHTGSSCSSTNNVGGVRANGNGTLVADTFINNTVVDNSSCDTISPGLQCDPGTTVDVRNSIVWANVTSAGDPQLGGAGCSPTDSWVQGVNSATDPYFKGGSPFDYHLQTIPPDAHSSPCIGAGTPAGAPAVDLDGNPRGNPPDMGCYQAQ